jgi:hypothetical protein
MNKPIIPINRVNKFFSSEDFNLEISMSREAIEGDGNYTVILYRVDRVTTQYDDLYGESVEDGIQFLPPVELKVQPIIEEPEAKSFNPNGTMMDIQDKPFVFGVFEQQLIELGVEINLGDYVSYQISETEFRTYSVVNNGIKNFDSKHTILGFKKASRTVTCAPVDESEFNTK